MKKLMSTMLAVCMLIGMLSGAVLFSGYAAGYETVKLTGFSGWTQAELDTSSGNNGYANGCSSALYVETGAKYRVGGTTQAIKAVWGGGGAYNNCIVNWKYQAGGPCTAGSVWAAAEGTVNASDYEGIRIAVLNSDGEPASFTRSILRLTYGWNYSGNMRYYDGKPASDEDGWLYFPFSEFQSNNGGGTDIYDYFDNYAKGISMLNYGSSAEDTCYYSGVELYRAAGAVNKNALTSALAKLKGYDDFTYADQIAAAQAVIDDANATQQQVDAQLAIINKCIEDYVSQIFTNYKYVQLTGVQDWTASDLSSLNQYGASYALSDKGLVGNATQSVELTVTNNFNRFCLASKLAGSGFLAKNPFRFADTSKGYKLSDFDGIAIAFADADGKPFDLTQFQVRLMRDQADWDAYYNYEGNYYDTPLVFHNGYYHLYFKDYKNLAGDAINDISVISALFYKSLSAGDKGYLSDICVFREENPEEELHDVRKVRDDLDGLLNEADALGFFDSTYERYDEVSLADTFFADDASTYDELLIQSRIVRSCIIDETTEGDLHDAFARCVNAWEYNYTSQSFAALLDAIDRAWATYEEDEAGALAILNAAYDALVPIAYQTTTANFFDGWTDTMVNDVVAANEGKLCDSIGDGLNKDKVYNAGDFSNNTAFEADNNFSMTALADFSGKAMGWKSMDRSKTLPNASNGAYPAMNVVGLRNADGIRFKLESTGGVRRILIGLSNCNDMVKEDYAMLIRPEFVAEDGYINIPFSYFEKAFWCNEKFNKKDIDQVIVFIIEAYGVEEDTTVTVSDLRGYKKLQGATAEDAEKVADAAAKLEAFDIDGRYAELLETAASLSLSSNFSSEYDEVYNEIMDVLKAYKDPSVAIVDVPGYSIYTQEELDKFCFVDGHGTATKVDDGAKFTFSGDCWRVVNGAYAGNGYEREDGYDGAYGAISALGDKDMIAMLGGYSLDKIKAFRFKIEGGGTYTTISYKDGKGLWDGMVSYRQTAYVSDGYYTFNTSEIPTRQFDGWYGTWTLDQIRENAKFLMADFSKNQNKKVYGWQVILFDPVDRSELKETLERFKGMDIDGYDDAMDVYYTEGATAQQLKDAAEALVNAAKPKAPAAPELSSVTYNSVTLKMGSKSIEFRCGEDGEWTSMNEFTGLEADTEYNFYARVRETSALPASDPSEPLVVRTLKAPMAGEVVIEGEAVYGETLTAVVSGIPEGAGELTYAWFRATAIDAVQVGDGAEYVVGKDDIGATLSVSVTAANLEGSIVSENTAAVAKATPELITAPAPAVIMIGGKLGDAVISGGEVSVEGTWAWADPELIPDVSQSGSAFAAVFTPADTDCYLALNADIIVEITSDTAEQTVTDEASGLSVTGEFLIGSDPEMTVADIVPTKPAYIALLRAARNSESENNLILFKNVSFSRQCFVGSLTLTAQLSAAKAGMEYTVWFFANGEVQSANATVDADGVITVSDFVADIA